MTRQNILDFIRRTAENGVPLGEDRLAKLGLAPTVWQRYWARLSAAQRECGFTPNKRQEAYPDEKAFAGLAALARELGWFPTSRDRIVKGRDDPDFPSERVFKRLGPRDRLISGLVEFCRGHPGFDDVLGLCTSVTDTIQTTEHKKPSPQFGSVYLLKGPSRRFKIGRTNVFGRRRRELAIQLPFDTRKVHIIETDDPVGVEKYWHERFASKRINGEWFNLDGDDVAAFKRWKRLR
jgi:hypothetical protein